MEKCHCGNEFRNTRYPGGPRKYGRRQIHCSPKCTQRATMARLYGLTPEEYWEMLRKQEGRCAVCLKSANEEKRMLAIDHVHVTGFFQLPPKERKQYVRGLLCILCNRHRMANTDIQIVRRMLKYLETFESKF